MPPAWWGASPKLAKSPSREPRRNVPPLCHMYGRQCVFAILALSILILLLSFSDLHSLGLPYIAADRAPARAPPAPEPLPVSVKISASATVRTIIPPTIVPPEWVEPSGDAMPFFCPAASERAWAGATTLTDDAYLASSSSFAVCAASSSTPLPLIALNQGQGMGMPDLEGEKGPEAVPEQAREQQQASQSMGRRWGMPRKASAFPQSGEFDAGWEGTPRGTCGAALRTPKVALLFLTRGEVHHERVWRVWLESAAGLLPMYCLASALCARGGYPLLDRVLPACRAPSQDEIQSASGPEVLAAQYLYNIYLHTPMDNAGVPEDSLFYGREIPTHIFTRWADHSMMEAVRLLVRAALSDALNQRFVLLSETCLPLYPPTVIYQQLMYEDRSRIDACPGNTSETDLLDTHGGRWTWRMEEAGITRDKWRKHGQWFSLLRPHAELMAQDSKVINAFARYCNSGWDFDYHRFRGCICDEHYVGTLLAVHGLDNQTDCGGHSTNTDWERGDSGMHPYTYAPEEINATLFLDLRLETNPDITCESETIMNLAFHTFRRVEDIMKEDANWTDVGPYPAIRQFGYHCPLFARKFRWDATDVIMEVLTANDVSGKKLRILGGEGYSKELPMQIPTPEERWAQEWEEMVKNNITVPMPPPRPPPKAPPATLMVTIPNDPSLEATPNAQATVHQALPVMAGALPFDSIVLPVTRGTGVVPLELVIARNRAASALLANGGSQQGVVPQQNWEDGKSTRTSPGVRAGDRTGASSTHRSTPLSKSTFHSGTERASLYMNPHTSPSDTEKDPLKERWEGRTASIDGFRTEGAPWVGRSGVEGSGDSERPWDRQGDSSTAAGLGNWRALPRDDAGSVSDNFVPHESVTQAVQDMMQLLPLDNLQWQVPSANPTGPIQETATAGASKAVADGNSHVSTSTEEASVGTPANAVDAETPRPPGPAVTTSDDGSEKPAPVVVEGAARERSGSPIPNEPGGESPDAVPVGPANVSQREEIPSKKPEEPEQATAEPREPWGGKVVTLGDKMLEEGIEPPSVGPAADSTVATPSAAPQQQPVVQQSLQAMIPNGDVDVMVWPRQVSRGSMTERGAQEAERALQETLDEGGSSRAP